MIFWTGLGVLFACALGGALLARVGWPFELMTSLLPQIGAAALLFALSLLMLGRPGMAALAVCAAAVCGWGARELFAPRDAALPTRDVRVVWANLLGERDAFRRAMRFAVENDADIVVFAEFPSSVPEADWRASAGDYAHHAGRPTARGVKVAVFSRLPLSDVEPIGIPWRPNRQGLSVRVTTAAGPLTIVGVHPSVPIIPLAQRARDETSRVAFARTREAGASALLVGDFNTTPWSPLVRDAAADERLRRAHLGAASTWASPWPILGLPIDHAFAANDARISARVGPGIGSDHLPLLIDVQVRLEIRPPSGLDGSAYFFFPIRPAKYASRPAITACFMARAMRTGSLASAMAVFMSTPSTPSSIATVASLAVPTPASTMTGTLVCSTMRRMFTGFWMPRPEPMSEPSGMMATQPASSSFLA